LDNIVELDEWMEFLDHYLKRTRESVPAHLENRVACAMILAMVMRRPDHPDFNQWVKRMHSHEDPHRQLSVLLAFVFYWSYKGEPVKTEATVNSMRRISETRDISPLEQATLKLAETLWYVFSGNAEKCVQACFEGLHVGENTGVHLLDFELIGNAIVGAYDSNRADLVAEYMEKMDATPEILKKTDRSFYHFLIAMQSFLCKDLPKADYHIQIALELALQAGFVMGETVSRFVYIQVLTDLGKHKEADEHLKKVSEFGFSFNSHLIQFGIMLIKAQKAFRLNREKEGLEFLRQGFTIARQHKLFSTYFAWRPSDIAELCCRALQHGIEVEYVQELIRRKNILPEKPPHHIENWPWPLKIYTFGGLKLLRDDRPIRYSRKTPKKPLELLRIIIALGGKNLSEQRLMDALWPDAEGDSGHKSLSVTLSRLRELLGGKDALQVSEGMISLDGRFVWTDVRAFELALERSKAAEREGKKDESARLLEKAIGMYQGHFLAGESASWAISPQERLRESFLHAIEALGARWEGKQEWQKAVEAYRKGVKADDLMEQCYVRMMSCLLKLGSQAEALSVYQRLEKTLEGYGVAVSPETEKIRRKILSNNPSMRSK
jgi:DNA-binding SARP family transcriptional activator